MRFLARLIIVAFILACALGSLLHPVTTAVGMSRRERPRTGAERLITLGGCGLICLAVLLYRERFD